MKERKKENFEVDGIRFELVLKEGAGEEVNRTRRRHDEVFGQGQ